MASNLALGTLLISLNVIVHTAGLLVLARWMSWIIGWFRLHKHSLGKTVAMVTTVLGLFLIHTVEIWIWAGVYLAIGVVAGLEDAVYFSTVTFATLGYGDIIPPSGWRVFAALEAMNGFILIGWSIAFLIAASTRHGPFRIGEHF
jgi:Ion channel